MTKSERLIFMVNLFRVRRKVTLDELARECEVSKRTIYRDFLSLSSLNIPLYFDNGYQPVREISLPALNFTEDEQEILGYCLRSSSLIKSSHLRKAIKNIELKILSVLPEKGKERLNRSFHTLESEPPFFLKTEDIIINNFIRALFKKEAVDVISILGGRKLIGLQPISLQISGNKWILCFVENKTQKLFKLEPKEIAGIRPIAPTPKS